MKSFKLFSTALFFSVLVASCNNDGSAKTDTSTADTSDGVVSEKMKVDDDSKKEDANKEIARNFIQELYGNKDSAAIDKYLADDIKQHDPILQDGKKWVKTFLLQILNNPDLRKTKPDIKKISADGDMVWTLIREEAPNGKVFARVEIYRIDNSKIVERWLISQPEPKTSANKNTMF